MTHSFDSKQVLTLLISVLTLITLLGAVLGWKISDTVSTSRREIEMTADSKYISKELFISELKGLNWKIDAVVKAVGARVERGYPRP